MQIFKNPLKRHEEKSVQEQSRQQDAEQELLEQLKLVQELGFEAQQTEKEPLKPQPGAKARSGKSLKIVSRRRSVASLEPKAVSAVASAAPDFVGAAAVAAPAVARGVAPTAQTQVAPAVPAVRRTRLKKTEGAAAETASAVGTAAAEAVPDKLLRVTFGEFVSGSESSSLLPSSQFKDDQMHCSSRFGGVNHFAGLKDNSITEAQFLYTLERMGNDHDITDDFVALIKELYRVCTDGALVRIRTVTPYYARKCCDPTQQRIISDDLIKMLSREHRAELVPDYLLPLALVLNQAGVNFEMLNQEMNLTPAMQHRMKELDKPNKQTVFNLLQADPAGASAATYTLVCVKEHSHVFRLARLVGTEIPGLVPNKEQNQGTDSGKKTEAVGKKNSSPVESTGTALKDNKGDSGQKLSAIGGAGAAAAAVESGAATDASGRIIGSIRNKVVKAREQTVTPFVMRLLVDSSRGYRLLRSSNSLLTENTIEPKFTMLMLHFLLNLARRFERLKVLVTDGDLGWEAMMCAKALAQVKVDIFQPDNIRLEILKQNVRLSVLDDQIRVMNLALSDHQGSSILYQMKKARPAAALDKSDAVSVKVVPTVSSVAGAATAAAAAADAAVTTVSADDDKEIRAVAHVVAQAAGKANERLIGVRRVNGNLVMDYAEAPQGAVTGTAGTTGAGTGTSHGTGAAEASSVTVTEIADDEELAARQRRGRRAAGSGSVSGAVKGTKAQENASGIRTQGAETVVPPGAAELAFGLDYCDCEQVKVPCSTVDDFYAESLTQGLSGRAELPHLMVIDTGGQEEAFFNGARKMFEAGVRPLIMVRYFPVLSIALGVNNWFRELKEKYGYMVFVYSSKGMDTITPTQITDLSVREVKSLQDEYARLTAAEGDTSTLRSSAATFCYLVLLPKDLYHLDKGQLTFIED